MNCYVYRSNAKPGMYLYLIEKDNFTEVPDSLMQLLGEVIYSFEFDLRNDRKLVKAEPQEVLRIMSENGFFLQMPPAKSELLGQKAN